ncbi:MAG: hypothetical protein IPI52_14900 [Bacteroidetes bacterium]|nr:hypothetical protein [Bacteroidota bacterium]
MIKFLLPFSYFYFSRVKSLMGLIFLLSWEIIPNLIILIVLNQSGLNEGLLSFVKGYIVFISFYELGYIMNDTFSLKNEKDGRQRLGTFEPSKVQTFLMIALRLIIFFGVSWYAGFWKMALFYYFYIALGLTFTLHNLLKNKDLKVITFVNLALLRFFAPCIFFIKSYLFLQLLYPVLMFYVLYRTLSYMDSKGILNMKSKESDLFKFAYYALFLGLSILISLANQHFLPIYANVYFLFWTIGLIAFRKVFK